MTSTVFHTSHTARGRRGRSLVLPEVVLFGLCFLILWIGV